MNPGALVTYTTKASKYVKSTIPTFLAKSEFYNFQPLTCVEFWQMVKQHYGHELGLSHEEMESLQISAEYSMQTR